MGKRKGRKKWKTVKIPYETWLILKKMKEQTKIPMYQIVQNGLFVLQNQEKAETIDSILPGTFDRAMWYCYKLANAVTIYKTTLMNVNQETAREKMMKTLDQLETRLKVKTEDLQKSLEELEENQDGKTIAKVGQCTKEVMKQILVKICKI